MRTKEVNVYTFTELSPRAQQRAIESRRRCIADDMPWCDEWRQSLEEFAKLAPITVRKWDTSRKDISITVDDNVSTLQGVRLWKWLHNSGFASAIAKDCPFTGYCGDEAILDSIRDFLRAPTTHTTGEDLFTDAAQDWVYAFANDMDYQLSDDGISQDLTDLGEEFDRDGNPA